MKLSRSFCLALCCICSSQLVARKTQKYDALKETYLSYMQGIDSVFDAYEATRTFLEESQFGDKNVIERIVTNWFYRYASNIDKSVAKELRSDMLRALRNNNYDPSAIPKCRRIAPQYCYDAFVQEVGQEDEKDELYESLWSFIQKRDFTAEELRDFLLNVHRCFEGDTRKPLKSLARDVVLPVLEDEAIGYTVSRLPRDIDKLYIARHMAEIRDSKNSNSVYQATKKHLAKIELSQEHIKEVLRNIDASSLSQDDTKRVYNLFDVYLYALEMPISQLPDTFEKAVDFVSTQYVQRKFANTDTTDVTQVYSALREALTGVNAFADVTSRWVRKLPKLGDKLNRNQTPTVVQSVAKYLQTHDVAELPKEYSDVASRKNLEADLQQRIDTVRGYLDEVDKEFSKDVPDIDLDEVADRL